MDGVKIECASAQGDKDADHAHLIDFRNPTNNDFLAVNQLTVTGTKKPPRPDLAIMGMTLQPKKCEARVLV
jgi:type I restriction enzyme, R subunit